MIMEFQQGVVALDGSSEHGGGKNFAPTFFYARFSTIGSSDAANLVYGITIVM